MNSNFFEEGVDIRTISFDNPDYDNLDKNNLGNLEIKEEYIDYHVHELMNPEIFNRGLMDWLIFYNNKRVHHAFKNKYSPVQYMLSLQEQTNFSEKCNWRWPYTFC